MHEFSIVQSLISMVEENAILNNAKEVSKVVLDIGVLSGVEPDLLKTAFETFKEISDFTKNSEIVINIKKLTIYCFDCKKEYQKEDINMVCPSCGSLNTKLLEGNEMLLRSLELIV